MLIVAQRGRWFLCCWYIRMAMDKILRLRSATLRMTVCGVMMTMIGAFDLSCHPEQRRSMTTRKKASYRSHPEHRRSMTTRNKASYHCHPDRSGRILRCEHSWVLVFKILRLRSAALRMTVCGVMMTMMGAFDLSCHPEQRRSMTTRKK